MVNNTFSVNNNIMQQQQQQQQQTFNDYSLLKLQYHGHLGLLCEPHEILIFKAARPSRPVLVKWWGGVLKITPKFQKIHTCCTPGANCIN